MNESISPNQYFSLRITVNAITEWRVLFDKSFSTSLLKDVNSVQNSAVAPQKTESGFLTIDTVWQNSDGEYMSVINVNYSILKCVINLISDVSLL